MANRRNFKALALLFVAAFILAAATAVLTSQPAEAKRCDCWVMYCTIEPPIYCWEECVPCPILPPPPWP